jgi:DNA topoisomerase-1
MQLVIVESPTKAKTISRFLGKDFKIVASFGHVRDLPEDKFGVDIKNDFKPTYVVIPKAKERIKEIEKEVKKAKLVILSTDPDREGEAIAYHLAYLLKLGKEKPYWRITFHEITEEAIKEALKNPRKIDINLVNAQQARRILDRIVGYKLSPLLWKKIAKGLSAGRVQSVALRLVVEREREIQNFKPQEYWTIEAILKKSQAQNSKSQKEFKALLVKRDGKKLDQFAIKNEKEAKEIVGELKGAKFEVSRIERKEAKRNPPEPFTTSTMQQVSWQRFSWPAEKTMQIAQQLYEMGLTTYHRTDSLNLSELALKMAEDFILKNFGKNYYEKRGYKTKSKVAQEAHEAIRPTDVEKTPEILTQKLNEQQLKLYDLIWRRFLACQMAQAIFDRTEVEILAKNYGFLAKGQILKFDGFLKVYPMKFEEEELPELEKGEILEVLKILPLQHFTQPPPRYTEATLIKELEKYGIGRPSTYAPILATIQERNYVKKDEKKRFYPTHLGFAVSDLLVKHFPEIVDINFTAKMEDNLDKIANGEKNWVETLKEFYEPFNENLNKKYKEIKGAGILEKTEKKCPKCGSQLIVRVSKYGRFLACSNYPKCKYTFDLENSTGILCPKCQKGEIIKRKSKKEKIFWGCSNYPKCDFVLWSEPTGEKCPKCDTLLVKENKKIKCSNKNCDFEKSLK